MTTPLSNASEARTSHSQITYSEYLAMNTNTSATVRITFADGTADVISTYGGARQVIANRYDVSADDLVYDTGEDRELIWLDEASSDDDNGAKAVAEIRNA